MSVLKATYDRDADVLYLTLRREPAVRGVEDRYGIVWRFDAEGSVIGVTIVDYRDRWDDKAGELIAKISERLRIPSSEIEKALRMAA
jgi:uncharacterized protein YuzE